MKYNENILEKGKTQRFRQENKMCQTDPIVGNSIKVEMYKHKSDKNIR